MSMPAKLDFEPPYAIGDQVKYADSEEIWCILKIEVDRYYGHHIPYPLMRKIVDGVLFGDVYRGNFKELYKAFTPLQLTLF